MIQRGLMILCKEKECDFVNISVTVRRDKRRMLVRYTYEIKE